MTHILKSCLLIISLLMISTWSTPLHASQDQSSAMTDGEFVIYNQVLGGGNVFNNTTPVGTIGQILTNIGSASTNAEDITPIANAGFWHAIQGTEDTLLTFQRSMVHQLNETDNSPITLGLGLNKPTTKPITVTIATKRLQSMGNSADYTIYNNGVAQTESSFIVVIDGQEYKQLTLTIINDRDVEEIDETIAFYIANVEGDDSVLVGPFSEYVINIPANDNWPITGTVRYLGSQTGNLIGFAKETTTNEVYPDVSAWEPATTSKSFTTKVPPGTYNICAFIDSNGEKTSELNEWEVKGSYTWTVTIDEDGDHSMSGGDFDNIAFAMDDPEDRYAAQFIEITGTYKAWFESYPDLLLPDNEDRYYDAPDDDWDHDGYTNFQEYLNGTDPTTPDNAYVYNGYDPAYDTVTQSLSKKYQIVTTNPIVPKGRFDESFLVDINYTTSDNNRGATGLGFSIHYNSTFMTFAGWSNVLTETLAGGSKDLTPALEILDEGIDDDGYEDTDKMIKIAWVSDEENLEDRGWPGLEVPLPLRLCTVKFTVKSSAHSITYGDTSVIRFKATSKDARYTFYGPPATVVMDEFTFDVDGNGKANALTDGLLIMRYLFGLILDNPDLQEDAIATDATRKSSSDIWKYLNNGYEMLDIDRDGNADALTDALLIMRYMFGFKEGASLIENAIADDAANKTDKAVIPYIKQYLPQKGSTVIRPTTE